MEIITPRPIQTECRRCGECCRKGSPTLHIGDADLLKSSVLNYKDIFTIRIGELVYNNIDDEFITIDYEIIKIREKKGTRNCIFIEDDGTVCTIYGSRPLQCRAFECWNTEKFFNAYFEERLTREHIIAKNSLLLDIIDRHNKRCSYIELMDLSQSIQNGEDRIKDVFDAIQYDMEIRHYIKENTGIPYDFHPLLLGRPLIDTIGMFGYKVGRDESGNYSLELLSKEVEFK